MLLVLMFPTHLCSTESCRYFKQNLNAGRPQMDSLIAALSAAFVPDTKLCLFAFPVDRLLQGALSPADSRIEDEDW